MEDDRSVSSLLHAMLDAQHYATLMAETCAQGLMMLSIDAGAVEKDVTKALHQHSELDWLIYNAPPA